MKEVAAPGLVPLVQRMHHHLRGRQLHPAPRVSFYPYVSVTSTIREVDGRVHLRLSDHLMGAPDLAIEGIVGILVCRYYRLSEARVPKGAVDAYEDYIEEERTTYRRRVRAQQKGRKHIDPVGRHRSLLESFLRVTLDMELTLPRAPKLSWSKEESRQRFGHWDPDHGVIVISQVLDDPRVPIEVLDYVVYHELLHLKHPIVRSADGRRIMHSKAFRDEERRFPGWKEAEAWLDRLARQRPKKRR